LAQGSKVIAEVRERALTEQIKNPERVAEKQTLLLFDAGKNSRLAIALSSVARLEEFARTVVERSGGQEVVQYRGQILPLIRVSDFLAGSEVALTVADPMQVVVYSEQGRSVGLVVGHISDIVEETLTVRRGVKRAGIAGSAVIQNQVTDLLDVPGIIRIADPEFYHGAEEVV
jgi:two-component system chemotaxis sensor kinase CheA